MLLEQLEIFSERKASFALASGRNIVAAAARLNKSDRQVPKLFDQLLS